MRGEGKEGWEQNGENHGRRGERETGGEKRRDSRRMEEENGGEEE